MSIAGENKHLHACWLFSRPDLLIRAARHYEGAEQILRRRAVFTAKQVRLFPVIPCLCLSFTFNIEIMDLPHYESLKNETN